MNSCGMGSAKIVRLPGGLKARWRLLRQGREGLRLWSDASPEWRLLYDDDQEPVWIRGNCGWQRELAGALLVATLGLAGLYLSGAAGWRRHDLAYGLGLAVSWAVVGSWDWLLGSRIGPGLARAVRLAAGIAAVAFVPVMVWIILGR